MTTEQAKLWAEDPSPSWAELANAGDFDLLAECDTPGSPAGCVEVVVQKLWPLSPLGKGRAMSDDHCPTCGSTVTVFTGHEGTSHYMPVEHDLRADLRAAEARARKATEALEAIADEVTNGVTANLSFIDQLARSALASIREGQR